MDLRSGVLIAGRYRLQKKIGAGGMGEVWAGDHVSIGVRVAMKTLLPSAAEDPQIVARFRREAYLLGRLRSDRVARVVDFVEDRRAGLWLVMDFVEGEPLSTALEQRCLSPEETIDLGVDIVTALVDLHRAKVVHRDLKPDNIILEPMSSGRPRAVIVDLGVSRMESGQGALEESITNITQADVAVGTIPYMAPEQFLSSRDVTGAADVYALGAILFRAVTGRHVYGDHEEMDYATKKLTTRAPPLSISRFDRVARGLGEIVARALERVPDQRYETAEAMLADLTALQSTARATALDLDATTEQAAPPSLPPGVAADLEAPDTQVDGSEQTRRMSRPPGLGEELIAESTLDSPGGPAPQPPSAPSLLRSAVAPSTGTRLTVPSPGVEPQHASTPPPAPEPAPPSIAAEAPRARTFTARILAAAVLVALVAGGLAGFEIHRLLVR